MVPSFPYRLNIPLDKLHGTWSAPTPDTRRWRCTDSMGQSMRGFIAPTDFDWYQYLSARPAENEVNFWKPSARPFKALKRGEPLFFKLKARHGHRVVGFGLFLTYAPMSIQQSWSLFGSQNGVGSVQDMVRRVGKYVSHQGGLSLHHQVGSILLVSPIFFPMELSVDPPQGWSPQIVSGAGYDLQSGEGLRIWSDCLDRASQLALSSDTLINLDQVRNEAPAMGTPRLVAPRLGQGTFRVAVSEAYGRCAISGEHSLPALDAAHIVPFAQNGPHTVDNGLLLRADIHRLYDQHYVSVTPDFRFVVSERLREQFNNGRIYYDLAERQIHLPENPAHHPRREHLAAHHEIFQAVG